MPGSFRYHRTAGEEAIAFVALLLTAATHKELFALRLPTEFRHPSPLWDFDFRCTDQGECWLAVPLTVGRLAP